MFMCDSERIRQDGGDGTGHGGGDEGRMELHVQGGQHGLPLPVAEQFAESSVYIKMLFFFFCGFLRHHIFIQFKGKKSHGVVAHMPVIPTFGSLK